jgi:hypothetical protein
MNAEKFVLPARLDIFCTVLHLLNGFTVFNHVRTPCISLWIGYMMAFSIESVKHRFSYYNRRWRRPVASMSLHVAAFFVFSLYATITLPLRPWPYALMLGAHKTGSTSLYYLARNSPAHSVSVEEETNFLYMRLHTWLPVPFFLYRMHMPLAYKRKVIDFPLYVLHSHGLETELKWLQQRCFLFCVTRDPLERTKSQIFQFGESRLPLARLEQMINEVLVSGVPPPRSYNTFASVFWWSCQLEDVRYWESRGVHIHPYDLRGLSSDTGLLKHLCLDGARLPKLNTRAHKELNGPYESA